MGKKKETSELGRRERQILEIVFRLGEASVGDVLDLISDPPAYDSVRTMLRLLEGKGYLKHRADGNRYVYRPTQSRSAASKSALTHLMTTFFQDSLVDTMAAVLDLKSDNLSEEELSRLESLIAQARTEGR
ncbi:BlaI/MecI/CopY family transcriptional regulator [bacterium]|jgi:predicted transcriptional regulator|nr:BlaI/MecI/CopY family transcriptional regulator [bacterium]